LINAVADLGAGYALADALSERALHAGSGAVGALANTARVDGAGEASDRHAICATTLVLIRERVAIVDR
jgi:hypothetical protein